MEQVSASASVEQICDDALEFLTRALSVKRAAVLVADPQGVLRFATWRGLSDEYRSSVEGHCPWQVDDPSPAPIVVPDARQDPSLTALGRVLEQERICALAFIPVGFGGRLLGKFMLYDAEPRAFDADDIRLAQVMAGHIAFALEHRRMRDDLEQRLEHEHAARSRAEAEVTMRKRVERQQTILARAGQSLSLSLDLDAVFSTLESLVVPSFADWYVVHLVDERGEISMAHVAHADAGKVELARQAHTRWPPRDNGHGVVSVIRDGEARLFEQVPDDLLVRTARDPEHLRLLRELGLHSAMVVPLGVSGRIIGALTFVSAESGRVYGRQELSTAEGLASWAAVAIDHGRLYRKSLEARRTAEEAAHALGLVAQANTAIAATLDPDDALSELARFMTRNLADYCVAYRLDNQGNILRAGMSHADEKLQHLVEALTRAGAPELNDANGAGAVIRTRNGVLAREIPAEMLESAAQNPAHLEVLRELAPRSSVIVPLQARDRAIGALALATTDRSGRRYDENDLALVSLMANHVALLIDNSRLYAEARAAARARDDVLAIVSHDLRSPLNTIVTACELLAMDDLPASQRDRTHGSIQRAATQMHRLLHDLVDAAAIDEGRLRVEQGEMELQLLVSELLSIHAPVADNCGVHLETDLPDGSVAVTGDHARLCQALSNLLGNAIKFTPEGGRVTLRVECARVGKGDGELRFHLIDTGPGIPADQVPHLFDRFWRADGNSRSGTGLGLTIARGIAEAHGGRIDVRSTLGEGSCFTLVLPSAPPREAEPTRPQAR